MPQLRPLARLRVGVPAPFLVSEAIPVLLPASQIARDTGLNLTTVKRIRSRRVQPSPRSQALLTPHAGGYARQQLAARG
jgi:hypothetical protein